MKFLIVTSLAFAAAANALVARRTSCCFHLSASGGVSGTFGQLSDGQNRVLGGLSAATYCIDDKGGVTDANGRGCIFSPPTEQYQCDAGAAPASGGAISCEGAVSYGGSSKFFACPTGDKGSFNVYGQSIDSSCVKVSLSADSCHANCPAPPPPPPPPAPPAPPKTCPAALTGPYEFPHLITPINSASPDQAYGSSFFGDVSSTISSLFNFDIPFADSGKTCSLVFLFPTQSQLQTSSFTFSGAGGIDFSLLETVATASTTFNNAPEVRTDYGVTTVSPGHAYTIATFECPAGQAVGFELRAGDDTSFKYFQDFNPFPIGLYITKC